MPLKQNPAVHAVKCLPVNNLAQVLDVQGLNIYKLHFSVVLVDISQSSYSNIEIYVILNLKVRTVQTAARCCPLLDSMGR